jgi:hypothetical protein
VLSLTAQLAAVEDAAATAAANAAAISQTVLRTSAPQAQQIANTPTQPESKTNSTFQRLSYVKLLKRLDNTPPNL